MAINNKIKVLMVDDHVIIRDGIKAILRNVNDVNILEEANSGEEALEILNRSAFDVVLVDIALPGMSGLELITRIKSNFPKVKTLALSMHEEKGYIIKALENGALGYLVKNSNKQQLLQAIRKVASGGVYFSDKINDMLIKQVNMPLKNINQPQGNIQKLTNREMQVLQLIAEEHSNAKIAEMLFISTKTVDAHRCNLIKKLHVKNTAGLIKKAYMDGILK
ncbi:MAG: response regulator transcription factor [Bacteroidales bacterium]|nr:response regulator transcription factor [Bacteroidales bacterium]